MADVSVSMKRIHFRVRGMVQGVGFRYFCVREAERLHLVGFVRNQTDGSVEAEAQGSEDALAAFEKSLRVGPQQCKVEEIEQEERATLGSETGFEIR